MVSYLSRRRRPRALPHLLFAAVLTGPAQAYAQTPAAAGSDPLDPKAQVPALRYESSLTKFRLLGSDKPLAWRDANDAVARIGGWRVYAREAQQPEPEAPPKPALPPAQASAPAPDASAKPMPAGHGGHKR